VAVGKKVTGVVKAIQRVVLKMGGFEAQVVENRITEL
jgi:hypothetical protein